MNKLGKGLYLALAALPICLVQNAAARPHAGFTGLGAAADSAATAGTNPAGITRFDANTYQVELYTINSSSTWEGQLGEDGPVSSSSESNTTLVPSGYLIMPINDKFTFGFTILGAGFSDDFGDWPGKYFVTSFDSVNINAFPSIAYRVNDKLSVAGSLALGYSLYDQERAIANVFDPGLADGSASLETDGFSVGFGLSALYEISHTTRWGLSYLASTEPTLEGEAKFSGLGPNTEAVLDSGGFIGADIEVESKSPQSLLLGVYHEFDNSHALTADLAWSEFSEFQLSEFYFDGEGIADNEGEYEDIWAFSLGYSWPVSNQWMLGVSATYVDDMVKDEERTPTLRLDSIWTVGLAAEWQWTPHRAVLASLSYMTLDDAPVVTPVIPGIGSSSGKYTERDILILRLALKFGG
ncbi:MAG: outer membrane protein transport protein [Halioglobus sp.]